MKGAIIISTADYGGSRPNAAKMADYAEKLGKNELTELIDIRGTLARDIKGAFAEMEAIAKGSRCRDFLYHYQINPEPGVTLTPEQWQRAVEASEKALGLEDTQHVVFRHVKDGREHYHVVCNRVRLNERGDLRAVNMGNDAKKREEIAVQLEKEFGLDGLENRPLLTHERGARAPKGWEYKQAERTGGMNPRAMKAQVTALYNESANGKEFTAALERNGFILGKGEKCDFVVIPERGNAANLARRIEGVNIAEIRAKLSDLDRERLPTEKQAREAQRERQDLAAEKPEPEKHYEGKTAARPGQLEARDDTKAARLMVSAAGKAAEKLTSYIEGVADFFVAPRKITYDEFWKNAEARREYYQQKAQEEKRERALENMRKDMKAGKHLSASDIKNLNRQDFEKIKHFGDDGMKQIIEEYEREQRRRDRENEIGRQRERER